MSTEPRTVDVYLALVPVASRTVFVAGRPATRWRGEWVARGTGTVMHKTPTRPTADSAKSRALAYLAKRPHLVNTTDRF